jgi:LmbE family N-acetylglucosaminyl deacetylase
MTAAEKTAARRAAVARAACSAIGCIATVLQRFTQDGTEIDELEVAHQLAIRLEELASAASWAIAPDASDLSPVHELEAIVFGPEWLRSNRAKGAAR